MNMNLDPQVPPRHEGFWRRQFSNTPTQSQTIFDLIFGIFSPILCLYFDPVLFRVINFECSTTRPLAPHSILIFTYTAVGLGMIVLAIWLVFYSRITNGLGLIAGVFFVGTTFAIIIGVLLLPMSLFGLLICVGLLGFIPFLTAFVYFRNAVRALNHARHQNPSGAITRLAAAMVMGVLLILCVPAFFQWQSPHLFPQWQVAPQYEYSCAGQ